MIVKKAPVNINKQSDQHHFWYKNLVASRSKPKNPGSQVFSSVVVLTPRKRPYFQEVILATDAIKISEEPDDDACNFGSLIFLPFS